MVYTHKISERVSYKLIIHFLIKHLDYLQIAQSLKEYEVPIDNNGQECCVKTISIYNRNEK